MTPISPADLPQSSDPTFIASPARLWPHREHESNAVKNFCCRAGLHRWRRLDMSELYPGKDVRFCFWCPKIEIDGVTSEP